MERIEDMAAREAEEHIEIRDIARRLRALRPDGASRSESPDPHRRPHR